MQILLLQDRIEIRQKVAFYLESTYGAVVHESNDLVNSMALLQSSKPPIELVIVDFKDAKPEEFKKFWETIRSIPTLVCSDGCPDGAATRESVIGIIDYTHFMDSIVSTINTLIVRGILNPKKSSGDTQVRIRTKLLLSLCPLKGDIYIRLSQDKFVKLFREGDVFDLNDLEKYTIKKGVEYLYIRQEQCSEFAQKYKLELQKLLKSDKISAAEVRKLGETVHETVQELSIQVGFTRDVQEITKAHVQLTVKTMGNDPQLAQILSQLKASEGKYISCHSTLCAYISCAIAAHLQWGSESTFYRLTLASFMHDITLTNHELAAFTTLEEVASTGKRFTEKEIQEFRDHPAVAAEMIKRMSEVPPDVDTIVRQHHERPDGSGFPRHLGHAYIAPLAAVFIVSHDLTQYVLSSGENFNVLEFLALYKNKYKSSQFKKILNCIEVLQKIKGLAIAIKNNKVIV